MCNRLRLVACLFSLCAIGAARPVCAAPALVSMEHPRTVKVDADLRGSIEQMFATSATFRRQCERLDNEMKLVVLLNLDPGLPTLRFRARSTIRRYTSGLLIVTIVVAPASDQSEWIAHEFEHVIEVLDGERLPEAAARSVHGVWQSVDGMVETERASTVGRTVLHEMRSIEVSDKYVE